MTSSGLSRTTKLEIECHEERPLLFLLSLHVSLARSALPSGEFRAFGMTKEDSLRNTAFVTGAAFFFRMATHKEVTL